MVPALRQRRLGLRALQDQAGVRLVRRQRELWAQDVPDGVAISEAVLLAGDLSTDASASFVNGLLARIAGLKPSLQV